MQAYSLINSLLQKPDSTYNEFEKQLTILAIQKETYLNLFLTTIVSKRTNDSQFKKYISFLLNFKSITGKKSADINYIGYKDRKSILMHACQFGNKENIEYLLTINNLNLNLTDPQRKTCLFYALNNSNEINSNAIINLLLDADPKLVQMQAHNNKSILFQALEVRRYSTIDLLLKRGADVNMQLKDSQNSVCHQLIKTHHQNKQSTIKLLLLFLKYKANFNIQNKQGKNVFQFAMSVGFDLSQSGQIFKYFQKESLDNQDKQSLTTLNQQTKKGDNASQLQEIQSNICSLRVDFSQTDFFQQDLQGQSVQQISCVSDQYTLEQPFYSRGVDFTKLQRQIQEFSYGCEQRHRQNWIKIHPFLNSLQILVNNHNLLMEIVGSFVTGLWSQNSNINLNLIPMQNQYINFGVILQEIFIILKSSKYQLGIDKIYLNNNKINTIKINLNQRYNYLSIDIAIFYYNNHNRLYVNYILETITIYPQIKPLFFVFKHISQNYGLNDHLFGGLKTYTLFLMIYSIVKNLSSQNLGELFNQIALYYGFYYQYEFSCRQEDLMELDLNNNQEIRKYPRMIFNFIDPLNPINNVGGKNTKVEQVQTMFKSLYLGLNQLQTSPYLQQLLQLHSIF